MKFLVPKLGEQKAIADCLSSIDDLITTQTQKTDALKAHKKGLMQKLFPTEGETVPKLRFPQFRDAGEWEEIKLQDLLKAIIDNRGKTPPLSVTGYPIIEVNALGGSLINYRKVSKYVDEETYRNWFRGHVQNGDILFSTVGAIAECSIVCSEDKPVIAQNIVGLRFNKNVFDLFSLYLLTALQNKNKFLKITMGAVQPSLNISQMVHLTFHIPTIPEQTAIADCLSYIDELITAQTQKINALKAHKKGLMQQFFPLL